MSLAIRARTPLGRPLAIAVVDYGMGNLGSVCHALGFLGHRAMATSEAAALTKAEAIVLPGVGTFAVAMDNLRRHGLDRALSDAVLDRRSPFLGICLGMQLLAQEGTENGVHQGLGWIEGRVIRLEGGGEARVPHVGWAALTGHDDVMFAGMDTGSAYYFDHSYHLDCPEPLVAARCAGAFACIAAIRRGNLFATQFHPEKSQRAGLRLLRAFTDYACAQRDLVAA
jgi:imidazole glycerol-phosphate synthase subunit HisH